MLETFLFNKVQVNLYQREAIFYFEIKSSDFL